MAKMFWDLGSTSNFVDESFVKRCGYKGKQEYLNVTTLGDVEMDLSVICYRCGNRLWMGT